MRTIEGKGMASGLFLRKISLYTLVLNLISFGCGSKITKEYRMPTPYGYYYFWSGSMQLCLLLPKISEAESKTLRLLNDDLYNLTSITHLGHNKARVVLSKGSSVKPVNRLILAYDKSDSEEAFIDVLFYSKLVDADTLSAGKKVIYDRNLDVVPPLVTMSSLQVAPLLLCASDSVYREFSSLDELYRISFLLKPGEYLIADGECAKPFFTYVLKGDLPVGGHQL